MYTIRICFVLFPYLFRTSNYSLYSLYKPGERFHNLNEAATPHRYRKRPSEAPITTCCVFSFVFVPEIGLCVRPLRPHTFIRNPIIIVRNPMNLHDFWAWSSRTLNLYGFWTGLTRAIKAALVYSFVAQQNNWETAIYNIRKHTHKQLEHQVFSRMSTYIERSICLTPYFSYLSTIISIG